MIPFGPPKGVTAVPLPLAMFVVGLCLTSTNNIARVLEFGGPEVHGWLQLTNYLYVLGTFVDIEVLRVVQRVFRRGPLRITGAGNAASVNTLGPNTILPTIHKLLSRRFSPIPRFPLVLPSVQKAVAAVIPAMQATFIPQLLITYRAPRLLKWYPVEDMTRSYNTILPIDILLLDRFLPLLQFPLVLPDVLRVVTAAAPAKNATFAPLLFITYPTQRLLTWYPAEDAVKKSAFKFPTIVPFATFLLNLVIVAVGLSCEVIGSVLSVLVSALRTISVVLGAVRSYLAFAFRTISVVLGKVMPLLAFIAVVFRMASAILGHIRKAVCTVSAFLYQLLLVLGCCINPISSFTTHSSYYLSTMITISLDVAILMAAFTLNGALALYHVANLGQPFVYLSTIQLALTNKLRSIINSTVLLLSKVVAAEAPAVTAVLPQYITIVGDELATHVYFPLSLSPTTPGFDNTFPVDDPEEVAAEIEVKLAIKIMVEEATQETAAVANSVEEVEPDMEGAGRSVVPCSCPPLVEAPQESLPEPPYPTASREAPADCDTLVSQAAPTITNVTTTPDGQLLLDALDAKIPVPPEDKPDGRDSEPITLPASAIDEIVAPPVPEGASSVPSPIWLQEPPLLLGNEPIHELSEFNPPVLTESIPHVLSLDPSAFSQAAVESDIKSAAPTTASVKSEQDESIVPGTSSPVFKPVPISSEREPSGDAKLSPEATTFTPRAPVEAQSVPELPTPKVPTPGLNTDAPKFVPALSPLKAALPVSESGPSGNALHPQASAFRPQAPVEDQPAPELPTSKPLPSGLNTDAPKFVPRVTSPKTALPAPGLGLSSGDALRPQAPVFTPQARVEVEPAQDAPPSTSTADANADDEAPNSAPQLPRHLFLPARQQLKLSDPSKPDVPLVLPRPPPKVLRGSSLPLTVNTAVVFVPDYMTPTGHLRTADGRHAPESKFVPLPAYRPVALVKPVPRSDDSAGEPKKKKTRSRPRSVRKKKEAAATAQPEAEGPVPVPEPAPSTPPVVATDASPEIIANIRSRAATFSPCAGFRGPSSPGPSSDSEATLDPGAEEFKPRTPFTNVTNTA